jgi:biopolymer transport protein TolR
MGMNVGSKRKHGPSEDINITPLIDVVLVLLIIFMVLVPSTMKQLHATIPRKDEANTKLVPPAQIVLKIGPQGQLSLDAETVTPGNLRQVINQRLARDADKVVFFDVDPEARYGAVIRFMDIVKGAGARKLAIVSKD